MTELNEGDRALLADVEAIFAAVSGFFNGLTPKEWTRDHGPLWKFGDVPAHLTIFNDLTAEAITRGPDVPAEKRLLLTHQLELDSWNNARMAERPAHQTHAQTLDALRQSQDRLRAALDASGHDLERMVWLPTSMVRGWRTARLALEYTVWHNWLHLGEAHLRLHRPMTDLPDSITQRSLELYLEILGGAADLSQIGAEAFAWTVVFTGQGGGEWTLRVEKHGAHVVPGRAADADITFFTTPRDLLATVSFGMDSALGALLRRRIRVRGWRNLVKLRRLFVTRPDYVWHPIKRGLIAPSMTHQVE